MLHGTRTQTVKVAIADPSYWSDGKTAEMWKIFNWGRGIVGRFRGIKIAAEKFCESVEVVRYVTILTATRKAHSHCYRFLSDLLLNTF